MNIVKIFFNESASYRSFYANNGELFPVKAIAELREEGAYRYIGLFNTELEDEYACEEIFDLSNNPNREDERLERWGDNRSLSVGDIVQVNDTCWICAVIGWVKV